MKQFSANPGQTYQQQMTFFMSGRPKGEQGKFVSVTITRRASGLNAGDLAAWTATCFKLPINIASQPLLLQGAQQEGEKNPYEFVFPAGTDIKQGTDRITDSEGEWRIFNTNLPLVGVSTIEIHCYCVLEKPV